MTTWKDGGYHGDKFSHDIISEKDGHIVCRVFTKQVRDIGDGSGAWPDEQNFNLILKALQMLEALENIQHRAEYMLEAGGSFVDSANWEIMRSYAAAATAAAKGDNNEKDELV